MHKMYSLPAHKFNTFYTHIEMDHRTARAQFVWVRIVERIEAVR